MNKTIQIGNKLVGDNQPCFFIAEIGINHNGDINLAKKLIDLAVESGCNAVKFQKRTVDVVYTQEELARPRPNPFGETNGDLKRGLEFGFEEYEEINNYCRERGIMWIASCWDEESVDFIEQFNPPAYKIASACLTDKDLLLYTKSKGKPIILATGMSTLEEIDSAMEILGTENTILLQCTATYPSENNELNLLVIPQFKERYQTLVGYSGHERGIAPSFLAAGLGACVVERHITLDRAMWGSDHAASLEPEGLHKLIRDIRMIPNILGTGKKCVYSDEKPIIEKLRRKKTILC
ncbi:MAG: N-acetylneuraminate synthase family protein [Candidatus Gastranaerophilales bacterium]|nr:N-acetylneuraminate synthase family protein [Candidatus Gastranaerophilales bacterium]